MLAGIVVDHLDAIAGGVRHADAARLGIECAVIELAAGRVRYRDDAYRLDEAIRYLIGDRLA